MKEFCFMARGISRGFFVRFLAATLPENRRTNIGEVFLEGKDLAKGMLMVVSKRWFEFLSGDRIPLPPFYLNLTSFLPQFYLILASFLPLFNLNLTSASSEISNHGLETTVYRPLVLGHSDLDRFT